MSLSNLFESKRLVVLLLAAMLSLSVLFAPSINGNRAFAHGDAPTECENVYDATIISMTIDNGVDTFDPIANPNLHFDANIDAGYDVTFTLHTKAQSYYDISNQPGTTWYRTTAPGFANGVCVDDVEANSLKTITSHITPPGGIPDNYDSPHIEWGTISDGDQIIYSLTWQQEPLTTTTADSESKLTVHTQGSNADGEISGYYTVLSKDGSTVATGFSPATFTLNNDEDYVVEVQDYGQYVFDHWGDTASTDRDRSISISLDTGITAIYRNVNEPASGGGGDQDDGSGEQDGGSTGSSGSSSVTVNTRDSSGNAISGYYTILYDSNGNAVQTGFTPATFDLSSGQQYTVEVQDYGSYYFNYWQDDGSTNRDKTFTATSSAMSFTAVYSTTQSSDNSCSGLRQCPPPQPDEQQTTGTISVSTTDSAGNQIFGYYTTLSQNGNVIQSGFSPAEFTVDSGQTYQVAVADYGQYVFDHWSDGSTDRFHDAVAGDSLVAVYRP